MLLGIAWPTSTQIVTGLLMPVCIVAIVMPIVLLEPRRARMARTQFIFCEPSVQALPTTISACCVIGLRLVLLRQHLATIQRQSTSTQVMLRDVLVATLVILVSVVVQAMFMARITVGRAVSLQ